METSAKENIGIDEAFNQMAAAIKKKMDVAKVFLIHLLTCIFACKSNSSSTSLPQPVPVANPGNTVQMKQDPSQPAKKQGGGWCSLL